MTPLRQRMLEDLQIRNYSPTTVRIYLHCVQAFAQHFGSAPDRLGPEHIRQYQLFLVKEKQVSLPTYIQTVCALRFFYTHTLHRKVAIQRIPFPRRERKLPRIPSREQVQALLEAPRTLRQRALLAILYGSGLRVSEAIELKVSDMAGRVFCIDGHDIKPRSPRCDRTEYDETIRATRDAEPETIRTAAQAPS